MKCKLLEDLYWIGGGRFYYTHPTNCNIFLIDGGKDLLLIDSGCGIKPREVSESIKINGLDPKNIRGVVNTHSHYDHVRGDNHIRDISGCEVMIHERGVPILEKGEWPLGMKHMSISVDRKLHDGDRIKVGKYELDVIHNPGHTPECISLHVEMDGKKVLFSGDLVMCYSEDFLGMMTAKTDLSIYKASIEKVAKLEVDALMPGHGVFMLSEGKSVIDFVVQRLSGMWRGVIPYPQPFGSSRWYIEQHPECVLEE
jgi:glyoxylase-like metal-dependent hydrolase (beta-lactamase superfamily II)